MTTDQTYYRGIQHTPRPAVAPEPSGPQSNVDLIGAAGVLSAQLDLARTCAATIYHKVAAAEPDATLWIAKHPEIQPLIPIAINFGKKVAGTAALVPDAELIIASLKQLHALAGSALPRRGGLE